MPATRVQTAKGGTAAASSYNFSWASNTSSGNLIVVSITTAAVSISSVTDSQSNSYSMIVSQTLGAARNEIWYAYNITGGTTPTITITQSSVAQGNAIAREYSGIASSDPLDKSAISSGTNGGGTASSGATAVTTQDKELIVGGLSSGTNPAVGTGYGNYDEHLAVGSTVYVAIEDKDQTSKAAQTATFTGTYSNWVCGIATFKEDISIDNSILDASDEFGSTTSVVFTSDMVGYVFYVDSDGKVSYRKTTDSGVSWSAVTNVTTQTDCVGVGVWYDQWTPGDTTGTNIYIAYTDSTDKALYYRHLNTSTDTFGAAEKLVVDLAGAIGSMRLGAPSICKATDGDLFAAAAATAGATAAVYKSTDTGVNWADTGNGEYTTAHGKPLLLPLTVGDVSLIIHDDGITDSLDYTNYDESLGSWSSRANINSTLPFNSLYPDNWGACVDKTSKDFFLAACNNPNSSTGDIITYFYDESLGSWSSKTNVLSNAYIAAVKIAIDDNTSDIYCVYMKSSDSGSTYDLYYKKSTDGMTTWGSEVAVTTTGLDVRNMRVNLLSDERIYAVYYDETNDDMYGDTIIDLTPTPAAARRVFVVA